jgi:hypothetical protein
MHFAAFLHHAIPNKCSWAGGTHESSATMPVTLHTTTAAAIALNIISSARRLRPSGPPLPPPHQRLALSISTACACEAELPVTFSASRRSIISLGGMKHRNISGSADRAGCGRRRTIDRLLHPAKCLAGEWRGVHMQEQRSACRRARRQHPPRCPRASARAVVTYLKGHLSPASHRTTFLRCGAAARNFQG